MQQTDTGPYTTICFAKAGSYTVEAYGNTADANSANKKKKKQAATTIVTIEENRISGVRHKGGNPYRCSEPAIFSIGTLFPVGTIPLPGGATTAATSWQVIKKSGEGIPALSATTGASVVVTCTGACDYAVIATLSGKAQQSEAMHAIKNRVTHVKADKESCRPGDTVSYTAEFRLAPTPLELAQLKWKCLDAHGGEHPKTLAAGSPTQNSIYGHAGHYKVYAYFHAPAKEAMAEVEVVQPSLEACYWRGMDGELKTITGWDEKTEISMSFKACDGLSVQVEIYVLKKEDRARILLARTEAHKIGSNNYLRVPFTTKRATYKGKLSEGDELFFKIKGSGNKWKIEDENTEQPRQHLKFSSKEKLTGIAFYKDGRRVTQAAYGDTLKCRVYGRNLSSGKDGVEVKIYRVEKRLGKDALRADTEMIHKDKVKIDERGYGEFDFTLDVAEGKKYDDPIHYFRAWIEENEVFGEQELSIGGANSTMLFAMKPPKEAKDGTSMVGIDKKEDGPKDGKCVCKEYDLVWGEKVSCEFRKKVVQICAELWGENRKMEMANGLMAVMKVETDGSFKAHQIMGKALKDVNIITKDDFWLITKDKKTGKEKKTSRAIGLIQFNQTALQAIGEFTAGSGFDKLHEVKLRFAKMGEIEQLKYVKKYFDSSKDKIKTPEDIYLHVFAPSGVGQDDSFELYKKGSTEYGQNQSIDTENKGKKYGDDGVIQRVEILGRHRTSCAEGLSKKAQTFNCGNAAKTAESINTTKPGFYIYRNGDIKYIAAQDSIE